METTVAEQAMLAQILGSSRDAVLRQVVGRGAGQQARSGNTLCDDFRQQTKRRSFPGVILIVIYWPPAGGPRRPRPAAELMADWSHRDRGGPIDAPTTPRFDLENSGKRERGCTYGVMPTGLKATSYLPTDH